MYKRLIEVALLLFCSTVIQLSITNSFISVEKKLVIIQ